jgi:hypothetical protein
MDPFQVRPPDDGQIIQLSHGHFIIVKKWLTAGEYNQTFKRMVKSMKTGESDKDGKSKADIEYDIEQMGGLSQAVEYLLDWSMKDLDGKPIVIVGKTPEYRQHALLSLPPEGYQAITKAIDAHVEKMKAESEDPKNELSGSDTPATSPSVVS